MNNRLHKDNNKRFFIIMRAAIKKVCECSYKIMKFIVVKVTVFFMMINFFVKKKILSNNNKMKFKNFFMMIYDYFCSYSKKLITLQQGIIKNFAIFVKKYSNNIFDELKRLNKKNIYDVVLITICYLISTCIINNIISPIIMLSDSMTIIMLYLAANSVIKCASQIRRVFGCGFAMSIFFIPMLLFEYSVIDAIFFGFILFCVSVTIMLIMRMDYFFASLIPTVIVCEADISDKLLSSILQEHKILAVVDVGNYCLSLQNAKIFSHIDELARWLQFRAKLPFFRFPRRIICVVQENSKNSIVKISKIASAFSISIFKLYQPTSLDQKHFPIMPVDITDFVDDGDLILCAQEREHLREAVDYKKVCIEYDGSILAFELIKILLEKTLAEITIFCHSESESKKILLLAERSKHFRRLKIQISEIKDILNSDYLPEILILSTKIKYARFVTENFRKVINSNIVDICDFITESRSLGIQYIFIMSSAYAAKAENWIGVTHRVTEFFAQIYDLQFYKTKQRVVPIRIPNLEFDSFGLASTVSDSIENSGCIILKNSPAELCETYYTSEVIVHLLNAISLCIADDTTVGSVMSILPSKRVDLYDILSKASSLHNLRINQDVHVAWENDEQEELEKFPSIIEKLNKTSIESVFATQMQHQTKKIFTAELDELRKKDISRKSASVIISSILSKIK